MPPVELTPCAFCHALVLVQDSDKHNAFHAEQMDLLAEVVSLIESNSAAITNVAAAVYSPLRKSLAELANAPDSER